MPRAGAGGINYTVIVLAKTETEAVAFIEIFTALNGICK